MQRSTATTDTVNYPNTCHRCYVTRLLMEQVLEHLDELNRCILKVQVHTMYLQEEIVQVKQTIQSLQLEELKHVHRGGGVGRVGEDSP